MTVGPVDPGHHCQGGAGDLQPQDREGDQHPVGADQLVATVGSFRTAALVAVAAAQVRVPACLPRAGQLGQELAQVMTGEADLATLRYQCLMAGASEMIFDSDLTLVRQGARAMASAANADD